MKRILLLTSLICASAYSMQEETEIKLKKLEVALQILGTPEPELRFLCPQCGSRGGIGQNAGRAYCSLCEREFIQSSFDRDLKSRAGATLVKYMHVLDKPEKK
jgi:hypothetical protein